MIEFMHGAEHGSDPGIGRQRIERTRVEDVAVTDQELDLAGGLGS